MSEMEYTYAVARIRALEVSLFSRSTIDALMACGTLEAALNLLVEKGWGGVYAETVVAVADMKIAVRCEKTGKSADFMKRALAPCAGLDTDRLAKAALAGFDEVCGYLASCGYGAAANALRESPSAIERWCDN